MVTLGIDTSNYATSLAVVDSTRQEVVCAKKRFLPVKPGELGLRQSDAVFHHTQALPELFSALQSEVDLSTIQGVGVSNKPRPIEKSYMPCFTSGIGAAVAFACGKNVPVFYTTHQQGHIAAAYWGSGHAITEQQALMFHVSGGTTELLLVQGTQVQKQLGTSLDLFAGQAVDRLGVRLGFAFPAGVHISALAEKCTEQISPKISRKGTNCHFSGLQNQCETLLAKGSSPEYVAKYCLLAIADTLIAMVGEAEKQYQALPVYFAGGVMASDTIRRHVQQQLPGSFFVPSEFSSDNAIGVAAIAAKELEWQI